MGAASAVEAQYFPGSQAIQAVLSCDPSNALYVPAGQAAGVDEPSSHQWPAGHILPPEYMQPVGHSSVESVATSKSHVGVSAAAYVQPVGQSACWPPTPNSQVAVPEQLPFSSTQPAGQAPLDAAEHTVPLSVQVASIVAAVPVHVTSVGAFELDPATQ